MHDVNGRVVVITGIGSQAEGWGNGTAMASLFARQGVTVFGCDLDVAAANRAAETIQNDEIVRECGGSFEHVVEVIQEPIDVTKMSSCKRFVDARMIGAW